MDASGFAARLAAIELAVAGGGEREIPIEKEVEAAPALVQTVISNEQAELQAALSSLEDAPKASGEHHSRDAQGSNTTSALATRIGSLCNQLDVVNAVLRRLI
ncbi:MAG TPA: hypothetical protein VFV74_01715 [Burkholderiales bacterium]|nr:hypothetical protein [Burkholderiales bacterium]